MKKITFLAIFSLLLLVTYVASADTSVKYPETFTLRVSETATVSNYKNMKITLNSIDGISTLSYPSQTRNVANIHVSSEGGCGPGADPRCLGEPGFSEDYKISQGNSVNVISLKITAKSITNDSATFSVEISSIDVYPPPSTCILRPACLDATPRCLIAEPVGGWCSKTVPSPRACTAEARMCPDGSAVGRTGPNCEFTACPGVTDGRTGGGTTDGSKGNDVWSDDGFVITGDTGSSGGGVWFDDGVVICPNGMTGRDCSTCRDGGCSTPGTPPPQRPIGTEPVPILTLPKGQDLVSTEKIEARGDTSAYYEIKTKKKARLFFLIPVRSETTYSIDVETGTSRVIYRPWWNFLAW